MTSPSPPQLLQLLEALAQAGVAGRPESTEGPSDANQFPPIDRTPFDDVRALLALFEEGQRINNALFRLLVEPVLGAQMGILRRFASGGSDSAPGLSHAGDGRQTTEDELFEMLNSARTWIISNPVAAQAVFSKLVAEGREFAKTEEGARWARALAHSDLVRKGRAVWETVTLNLLEERPNAVIPRTYLDVLRVASSQYDDVMARLRQDRPGGRHEPVE